MSLGVIVHLQVTGARTHVYKQTQWIYAEQLIKYGATENAGVENAMRSKTQGWNMQEWKSREQIAGVENAGVEKLGTITDGKP